MKFLKNILYSIKKWYMRDYTYEAEQEEERNNQLHKAIKRFSWQLSQMEADKTYINQVGDSKISFTGNVISGAKRSVKREQENNPEWAGWVREWQNETHITQNETYNK